MRYNNKKCGDYMIDKISNKLLELFDLFKSFLSKFLKIAFKPEMRILPGNLAFFLVLSLAPILTIIALLASKFSIPLISFINDFKKMIPEDLYQMFNMFLTEASVPSIPMIIYLSMGFFIASNGAHSIIVASNTLYKVSGRNFFKRRIKSFFLTILLILQFIFILIFLVYGNILMKWVLSFSLFDGIRGIIFRSFVFFKWPLMMLVTYILIKLLYALAPDIKIPSKKVNKGAIFTTIGWTLATAIYSFYANNLADYSVFYGSLSNLIVLMMWIYVVSYILVMGIAINVSHYGILKNKN